MSSEPTDTPLPESLRTPEALGAALKDAATVLRRHGYEVAAEMIAANLETLSRAVLASDTLARVNDICRRVEFSADVTEAERALACDVRDAMARFFGDLERLS